MCDVTLKDIGPEPQSFDLKEQTAENQYYRTVVWSGRYLQLTLMSISVGADIGLEMHPETDQFLGLEAGRGRVQMGSTSDNLDFDEEVSPGWCVLVPAGTWHNITNIGDEPMKVHAIYAPAHHQPGKIHATAELAASDADNEPAEWSVQPGSKPDLHG
jgi:mannose-6-phosphate isomerase-like protein (cupin superfamily)